MLTEKQIVQAVQGKDFVMLDEGGVRYQQDGWVIEILTSHIAVKGSDDDNMSWEIFNNPTLEDVQKTIDNPLWFY